MQRTYQSYMSAALALLTLIVVGVFDTSGHVISSVEQPSAQTEVLVKSSYSNDENSVFEYEKWEASIFAAAEPISLSDLQWAFSLLSYQIDVDVRIKSQSQGHHKFDSVLRLQELRRVPRNSDDSHRS